MVYKDVYDILNWVRKLNTSLLVKVTPNRLSDSHYWYYDKNLGCITNTNHSFFTICGIKDRNDLFEAEQPIIMQEEIGFLGMLCREMKGVLYFLMQAKIEPGNINHVQISPTIQATKSNFLQKHGGKKPPYLEYFLQAPKGTKLVDQLQSEQSSRFYKKRNRNIIQYIVDDVDVLPNYCWMTLPQIKKLMRYDNLVNMDTRTVLSCIPYSLLDGPWNCFKEEALRRSVASDFTQKELCDIYSYINNYKMFCKGRPELVRLDELRNWEMDDWGIRCQLPYSFSVIYCTIEVEGREVQYWTQPLFKAEGEATFGLFTAVRNDEKIFLVKPRAEIGCFDMIELGPTIQREAVCCEEESEIDKFFFLQYKRGEGIQCDVLLSEEGGRFYHEQNRNIILETDWFEPPQGYFWVSFRTLNLLTQVNNCLNIQLRNLLSLLEI